MPPRPPVELRFDARASSGDAPPGGRREADALPLPTYCHVPGRNARPDDALFERVRAQLPATTTDAGADRNVPWHYGLRLAETGFHWEAHEVLEGVWWRAAPNARERHLVQATIHLVNAALKAGAGRSAAAHRIALRARECAARAFPGPGGPLMGIAAGTLEREAARVEGARAESTKK